MICFIIVLFFRILRYGELDGMRGGVVVCINKLRQGAVGAQSLHRTIYVRLLPLYASFIRYTSTVYRVSVVTHGHISKGYGPSSPLGCRLHSSLATTVPLYPLVLERSVRVDAAPPREHHPRAMSPTRAALPIRERIYKCPPSAPQPSTPSQVVLLRLCSLVLLLFFF